MSLFPSTGTVFLPVVSQAVLEADRHIPVGLKLFPDLGVPVKSAEYLKIKLAQLTNRNPGQARAPGGTYPRIENEFESDTYECVDWGIEHPLDDADANALSSDNGLDAATLLANMAYDQLLRMHDYRVATVMGAAAFNSTGATAAFDNSSGVPITDIRAAVRRLNTKGILSNIYLVLTGNLFDQLIVNAQVKSYMGYGGDGIVGLGPDDKRIHQMLNVSGILVADSWHNASAKGQTPTALTNIWTDATCYVAQIAGGPLANGGVGRTVRWTVDSPSPVVVETYREDNKRSTILRTRHTVDEINVNVSAAEKLTSCT